MVYISNKYYIFIFLVKFIPRYFAFFILFYFIYLFLAVLGLHCCARAFSSCGEQGLLFIEVRRLLIVVASLFFFLSIPSDQWLGILLLILFIYLFLAVLGLRFCARAFSSCGERGPLFIVVRGPLTVAASPVAEHRLQTRRLSSCGSRA